MAFVSEDGTGLATANALTDVAFADEYFTDRNITAWIGTTVVKQAALIKATDYIETRFGSLFYGDKKSTTQALSHLRANTTTGEFPVAIKRAVCEYAVRSLTATLLPDPEIHASGQGLERTRSKVGPIEEETRFQYQGPGTQRIILRPYPAADILLKGLIKSSAGTVIRG